MVNDKRHRKDFSTKIFGLNQVSRVTTNISGSSYILLLLYSYTYIYYNIYLGNFFNNNIEIHCTMQFIIKINEFMISTRLRQCIHNIYVILKQDNVLLKIIIIIVK